MLALFAVTVIAVYFIVCYVLLLFLANGKGDEFRRVGVERKKMKNL